MRMVASWRWIRCRGHVPRGASRPVRKRTHGGGCHRLRGTTPNAYSDESEYPIRVRSNRQSDSTRTFCGSLAEVELAGWKEGWMHGARVCYDALEWQCRRADSASVVSAAGCGLCVREGCHSSIPAVLASVAQPRLIPGRVWQAKGHAGPGGCSLDHRV